MDRDSVQVGRSYWWRGRTSGQLFGGWVKELLDYTETAICVDYNGETWAVPLDDLMEKEN